MTSKTYKKSVGKGHNFDICRTDRNVIVMHFWTKSLGR